jgi:pSer/pThr/pTyr-binding forkhead associated (FHA) protein
VTSDEAELTLGRDPSCQLVLAQQAVSRNHARIVRDGTLFFIEDLGSSYGTQVNREKLPKGEKRLLRNGDIIAIGTFDVTFETVSAFEKEDSASKTMFVSRKAVKDVMKGLTSAGEQPYFRIMTGPTEGGRIELSEASELVFGRDPAADIVLNDDLVSRRHAKVRRDWSGAHVEDLGSRNGIKVNRKRMTRATLKDRDEVEIGALKLLYIDPNEVQESQVVLAQDDEENTLGIKDEVPPAPPEKPAEPEVAEAKAESESAPDGEAAAPPADSENGFDNQEAGAADDEAADEEKGSKRGLKDLVDFSNRQTLIILGVGALVALLAIGVLVLLFAGA